MTGAILASAASGGAGCRPPGMGAAGEGASGGEDAAGRARTDGGGAVESARELDQQGVASYRAGRFADAMAYFRAAYAQGGPPSELWNIIRCREALDDAEGASAAID